MKIDVEGYEDRVLRPLLQLGSPALWPRRLVIEDELRCRWSEDCFALLQDRSYRLVGRTRGNAMLERVPRDGPS